MAPSHERPTRDSIFRDAARRMRSEFEDARNNVPHRGEAGGEGEDIVRKFLNDHLPARFRATGGFIIDKADQISGHTDVIIYDAFNCPVYRTGERTMVIPNDNVASVVEVKFQLTTSLLDSALDKIHEAKNLTHTPHLEGHTPGELITAFGIIFAFECNLTFETVVQRWIAKLSEENPLNKSCSLIVILDKGIYFTGAQLPGRGAAPIDYQGDGAGFPVGTRIGIAFTEFRQGTLDAMVRLLLAHLTVFRHRVDHPGFNFQEQGPSRVEWILESGPEGMGSLI